MESGQSAGKEIEMTLTRDDLDRMEKHWEDVFDDLSVNRDQFKQLIRLARLGLEVEEARGVVVNNYVHYNDLPNKIKKKLEEKV